MSWSWPSADTTLTATGLDGGTWPPESAGGSNPGHVFRYDGDLGGYVYNLVTTGSSSGAHTLSFTAEGDPRPHSVTFVLR